MWVQILVCATPQSLVSKCPSCKATERPLAETMHDPETPRAISRAAQRSMPVLCHVGPLTSLIAARILQRQTPPTQQKYSCFEHRCYTLDRNQHESRHEISAIGTTMAEPQGNILMTIDFLKFPLSSRNAFRPGCSTEGAAEHHSALKTCSFPLVE